MEKKWSELSPEEKREERFKRWLTADDVNFISTEVKNLYRKRNHANKQIYKKLIR